MTADPLHTWTEAVERCVCCWKWCTTCRRCKCQVETRGRRGLGKACEGAR